MRDQPIFFSGHFPVGEMILYFIIRAEEGICHLTFSAVRHQKAWEWLITRMNVQMLAQGDDREPGLRRQINEFFQGTRRDFHFPVSRLFLDQGTAFQGTVWDELTKIPYGETRTYGTIAGRLGRPHSYRAVGRACGANPLALIIPCHRVIAIDGLGGFAGGTAIKHYLIKLEKGGAPCLP